MGGRNTRLVVELVEDSMEHAGVALARGHRLARRHLKTRFCQAGFGQDSSFCQPELAGGRPGEAEGEVDLLPAGCSLERSL